MPALRGARPRPQRRPRRLAHGPARGPDGPPRLGGFDSWINAAAELVAGPFGEPPEEGRRLLRSNIDGYANGSRAALEQFRSQGYGALVNVGSLLGVSPNELTPHYTVSKYAVTGLTRTLRLAMVPHRRIGVSLVLPPGVDTPMFRRAVNHTGAPLRAIPPAVAPERVAAAVLACIRRPRRQLTIGLTGRAVLVGLRVSPRLTEWAMNRASARLLVVRGAADDGVRNEPDGGVRNGPADAVHGGFRRGRLRRGAGERWGRWLARR
ncbi:MAG: SDR family NAD(P)-dependent oxidoreductase [Acidimicrobiales bacterium]